VTSSSAAFHVAALTRLRCAVWTAANEQAVLDGAVRSVAETLDAPLAKILEYLCADESFVVRAGVGWQESIITASRIPATSASQAGYTLRHRGVVVFDDLPLTRRFTDAVVLRAHGVVSSLSITLIIGGEAFGVLSVHDTQKREFSSDALRFLGEASQVISQRLAELRRPV
jgi:GAF domain-containing protein